MNHKGHNAADAAHKGVHKKTFVSFAPLWFNSFSALTFNK